ncbi:class I SAM-dependent methyltransferase [Candidatus Poribacteria bacterium]|nr:class I SAM-dependent methyltransferase [Candidatus Poribacteria bacterium]
MISRPKWQYGEMKHAGVDYNSPAQVEAYDINHQKFRNYQKQTEAIIQTLELGLEHTVIDMGAGTGAFALHAARHCKIIYAVDVSKAMLDYSRQKAEKAGIKNIVFCHGGFLTYEHRAEPVDAMVCVGVLHHLPDFWKLIGLRRALEMLKSGGKLYLFDVVFPVNMTDYKKRFDDWIQSTAENIGTDFAKEVETHIRDEYSTYDWIMEGLLKRAGFQIDKIQHTDRFGTIYICTSKA